MLWISSFCFVLFTHIHLYCAVLLAFVKFLRLTRTGLHSQLIELDFAPKFYIKYPVVRRPLKRNCYQFGAKFIECQCVKSYLTAVRSLLFKNNKTSLRIM